MEGSETDSKAFMIIIVWQKGKTTRKTDIFVHQCYFLFIKGSVHAWETEVCLFISGFSWLLMLTIKTLDMWNLGSLPI